MKYAMCPNCGRRLCKGEPGTKVEIECSKCGTVAVVEIQNEDMHIMNLGTRVRVPLKQEA